MQQNHRIGLRASAAVAALLATGSFADQAIAETAATADKGVKLEEIIVTAQRREENLQSVPLAVTALSAETLRRAGVATAEELMRVTPSFTVSRFVGRADQVSFGIRGQRTLDERITNDGAVIPYIAEVPIARPYGVGITGFLDLRSVEIVKGPVGTLFGRNTTGGAVLLTPNTPSDHLEGEGRLTLGNYGYAVGEAIVNVPVSEGSAFRVAVTQGTRDGFVENRGGFSDLGSERFWGGRASFLFEKGDFKSISYADGLYYRSSGASAQLTAVDPNGTANHVFPFPVGGGMVQALNEQKASDFWSARTSGPTFAKTEIWGVSNTTTYALSDKITLKNILGFRRTRTDAYVDTDDSRFVVIESSLPAVVKQFTEEAQIQYAGDRLRLIGGAFYFDEKGWNGGHQDVLRGVGFRTDFDEHAENVSKSVFAEGAYSVTDQFTLTLGGRYTWDERRYSPSITNDFRTNVVGLAPRGVVCIVTDARGLPVPGCRAHEEAKFKKPTFNVTGQYRFSPEQQVYASVRTGYRTGGFSVASSSAAQRVPYNPETVVNYEVGFKGDFDLGETALRLNAAAYYSDYKDVQRTIAACIGSPCTLVARVQNAAAATIKGVELELTWRLTDNLQLSGFYSYIDASYDRYFSSAATGAVVDLSKQPFTYLPKNKLGGTVRYTIPVQAHDLALQANASYQSWSNLSGDEAPGPGIRQPGYTLVNLRAELPLTSRMTVALWGRNVFNKEYYTSGINAYFSVGYAAMYPGEPRTYGVELSAKF